MKKRILLVTLVGAIGYIGFSSYSGGPAANGQNRTGAKGSTTNCSSGGCHGSGTGTTATITVDSAGAVPVTKYKPGMIYTVTVSGTNTAALTKFGFQYAAVSGIGASQVNAGTFSGLPTSVAIHSTSGLNIVEHSATLSTTTAGTYSRSFQWTAPAAGTGTVTMYLTLNAVDGNGSTNSADVAGNVSKVLTEILPSSVADVHATDIQAYPNPVSNTLNITFSATGAYAVNVFGLNGNLVATQNVMVTGLSHVATIDATSWAPGLYHAVIDNNGEKQVVPVVKQ
jgi:hypothetical protein